MHRTERVFLQPTVLSGLSAVVILFGASQLSAQDVPIVQCSQPCEPGFMCGEGGQCVATAATCNPACAIGYVCQAGQCVAPNFDANNHPPVIVQEEPPPPPPPAQGYAPGQAQTPPPQQGYAPGQVPPPPAQQGYAPGQPAQQGYAPQTYAPPPTRPETPRIARPGAVRIATGFHLGIGGEIGDAFGIASVDLAPSYGFGIQLQKPIWKLFILGVDFLYRSAQIDGDVDRFNLYTVDFMFGVHYAFPVGALAIDPFFNIGVGFAALTENDGVVGTNEYGVDAFFRIGANLWLASAIGVYVAGGYRSSALASIGGGGLNIRQGTFEVGATFRLGG